MAFHEDGSGQATATLTGVERRPAPMNDESGESPLRPAAAAASVTTAALQRRIGAPRTFARWSAGASDEVASAPAELAVGRPRKVPARSSSARASTPPVAETSSVKPSRIRDPEQHCFSGTLSVTVGPFGDLDPIGEFAEALKSIPGVGRVHIRTFDRASVVFDVDLAAPTAVIAQLRGRSHRPLRLLHANDRIIRFKLA